MKKIIKERYDKTAKFYNSRYSSIQKEKYNIMSKYFPKKWNLALDLGCGTGLLSKHYPNLIGLDISIKMLEVAKNHGEIVIQGESENLPFKSKIFDVIFSFTALQSSDNLNNSIKEAKRVLKDRGILIITYLKKKYDSTVLSTLKKYFNNIKQVPCGEDIGIICQ